jgi:hypothetical protein
MITYKIIGYNNGSITVQYSKNNRILATYNYDVPLTEAGLFITNEELDRNLTAMMPTAWADRLDALERGVPNENEIKALVQVTVDEPISQPESVGLQDL